MLLVLIAQKRRKSRRNAGPVNANGRIIPHKPAFPARVIKIGTLVGTLFLLFLQYRIYYKSTDTYYYDFFFPYTCILDENQDVYIREIAHYEAVTGEETDNNVRKVD
jgi:hypothetical protein